MDSILENSNVTGLSTLSDELEQELGYFVKLFQIRYADDAVLLAESASIVSHGKIANKHFLVEFEFLDL